MEANYLCDLKLPKMSYLFQTQSRLRGFLFFCFFPPAADFDLNQMNFFFMSAIE